MGGVHEKGSHWTQGSFHVTERKIETGPSTQVFNNYIVPRTQTYVAGWVLPPVQDLPADLCEQDWYHLSTVTSRALKIMFWFLQGRRFWLHEQGA